MCDSFEIDCIEEICLHAYFNTFYIFPENSISKIFTRIRSKENMQNNFELKLRNAQYISARNSSQENVAVFLLKIEEVESLLK